MNETASASYSIAQRAVHWLMAALILFNLIFTEAMETYNRALHRGGASPDQIADANIHAYVGMAVLVLAIARLALRLVQGAPQPPADEPRILRIASRVAHWTFYLLFLLVPLSGIAAYYGGVNIAGDIHGGPLKLLMWVLILTHVAAVVVHQFHWKTSVLKRMTSG